MIWIAKPWERPLGALMNSSNVVVKNDAIYVVCPVVLTLSRSPEGSTLSCLDQSQELVHSFNRLHFWNGFHNLKFRLQDRPQLASSCPTWFTMTFWCLSQNLASLRARLSCLQTVARPRVSQRHRTGEEEEEGTILQGGLGQSPSQMSWSWDEVLVWLAR